MTLRDLTTQCGNAHEAKPWRANN